MACISVMWTKRVERFVHQRTMRQDRTRLISAWVAWKRWYRRQHCLSWRRGLSLAARRLFMVWKSWYLRTKQRHVSNEVAVRAVIHAIVDEALRQIEINRLQATTLERFDTVLWRMQAQQNCRRLFLRWRSLAISKSGSTLTRTRTFPPSLDTRVPLPQRVASVYRRHRQNVAQNSLHHRPRWR